MTNDDLLSAFLEGFLWVDSEYLDRDGNGSASYWFHRLPVQITVEAANKPGFVKWRAAIPLVEEVPDPDRAVAACLTLNEMAAGWSFAHDDQRQTVFALAAMACPPGWHTYLLRMSEVLKLAAWLSEALCDWLAQDLGGRVAVSWPASHGEPRQVPDATLAYPQARRARPEWLMDLVAQMYPPMNEVAPLFGAKLGEDFWDDCTLLTDGFVYTTLYPDTGTLDFALSARFDAHPVFGRGWTTEMTCTGPTAEAINGLAWALFNHPDLTLLGAWVPAEEGLTFRQWSTSSEIRHYESLDGFQGHDPQELWRLASTGNDAVMLATSDNLETHQVISTAIASDARRVQALRSIDAYMVERDPFSQSWSREGQADRRLLWLPVLRNFITATWFNPAGPTVSTIDLCEGPRGDTAVVFMRRHPFLPRYVVIGSVETMDDLPGLLAESIGLMVTGSSPSSVWIGDCPEELKGLVTQHLREGLTARYRETGSTLGVEAARLEATFEAPWDWASLPSGSEPESSLGQRSPEEQFEAWWGLASDQQQVLANFRDLPWAWDGAINFQRSHGNESNPNFDWDPMLLIYSDIGTIDPQ